MKYDILSREEGTKVLYRSTDRRVSLCYKPSCSTSPSPSLLLLLLRLFLSGTSCSATFHCTSTITHVYILYAEYFYWFIGRGALQHVRSPSPYFYSAVQAVVPRRSLVWIYSPLICITCFPKYTCFFSLLLFHLQVSFKGERAEERHCEHEGDHRARQVRL